MKFRLPALMGTICFSVLTAYTSAEAIAAPAPDAIFTNGSVYTVDEEMRQAEAFAVKDGKFVAVGNNKDIAAMAGPQTTKTDLKGKFITPGFIDTHFHSVAAATITAEFDTGPETTNKGMYARLREFAATQKGRTEPLITYGCHLANFPPEVPVKEDLDAIFPDYPVLFIRSDGQAAWANTKALEAANITAETPDPTKQMPHGASDRPAPACPYRERMQGPVCLYRKR